MKSRTGFKALLFSALVCFCASVFADTKLPEPQMTGGKGIFDVLKARSSAKLNTFPQKPLSLQELSNLLWAATGLNRAEKGWTTPYGMGMAPYNKIYVACDKGVSLYDWKTHSLKSVSTKNIKGMVGKQAAVASAPVILIIVSDSKAMGNVTGERAKTWADIASGAMSQNIYLAAASMDIGTRYIVSMNTDVISKELQLNANDMPINIMPLGKN
ncbi:SagB/ThcOx family dehydrogenase [Oxalobacter sp. OttesenSCG-928-P03]|nr:SagB/ThcOx family dehydrogenase [Oxalobacter sp. OttesenSCG-928-P03]